MADRHAARQIAREHAGHDGIHESTGQEAPCLQVKGVVMPQRLQKLLACLRRLEIPAVNRHMLVVCQASGSRHEVDRMGIHMCESLAELVRCNLERSQSRAGGN